MIVLSWNNRGLNDPRKVAAVKKLLSDQRCDVIFILETKVKKQNCTKIQKKIGYAWSWVDNYNCSLKGRIWVGWKVDLINLTVL